MAVTAGEREGARDAIKRLERQFVDNGMKSDTAKQKAREAAIAHDRNNPKK